MIADLFSTTSANEMANGLGSGPLYHKMNTAGYGTCFFGGGAWTWLSRAVQNHCNPVLIREGIQECYDRNKPPKYSALLISNPTGDFMWSPGQKDLFLESLKLTSTANGREKSLSAMVWY